MNVRPSKIEVLFAAIVGGIVSVVALGIAEIVLSNYSVCTGGSTVGTPTFAWAISAIAYLGIVAAGFRNRRRLPFAWALAGIVGPVLVAGLTLAFPTGDTYCET
jgi:hypothetical protein